MYMCIYSTLSEIRKNSDFINQFHNTPFQLFVKENNVYYNGTNGYRTLPFQQNQNYMTVEYGKFYASYSLGFRFKF